LLLKERLARLAGTPLADSPGTAAPAAAADPPPAPADPPDPADQQSGE